MKRRNSKYWFENEKKVMKKLGLRPVPGSGCGQIHKEDGENDYILCQLKSTEKESFVLKRLDIEKLIYNADVVNKIPLFAIQFMNGPILLATFPEELGNISKYLNEDLFVRKQAEVIAVPKQPKERRVVKSSRITKDELLDEVQIIEDAEEDNENYLEKYLKRKNENKGNRNGRRK